MSYKSPLGLVQASPLSIDDFSGDINKTKIFLQGLRRYLDDAPQDFRGRVRREEVRHLAQEIVWHGKFADGTPEYGEVRRYWKNVFRFEAELLPYPSDLSNSWDFRGTIDLTDTIFRLMHDKSTIEKCVKEPLTVKTTLSQLDFYASNKNTSHSPVIKDKQIRIILTRMITIGKIPDNDLRYAPIDNFHLTRYREHAPSFVTEGVTIQRKNSQ